ncbi:SAM-dependent methyltransferase [Actinomadura sp. LOL_016]|uniref:SAM-dependent methyltransferase n=1 Tax=unclassified Actinomadura TaxID=2626254 RepID=UPI003A809321
MSGQHGDNDVTRPSPARVYDYLLGGTNNWAADRQAAEAVLALSPQMRNVAVENREFLIRAVEHVTRQGATQFLDLGSGLPTQDNTHQVAQRHNPDAHVVYVDRDETVLVESHALLGDSDTTAYVQADVRDPGKVLEDAVTRRLIDFSRPVTLLLVAVLHFVPDDDDPAGLVAQYVEALPSGSTVVIASGSSKDMDPDLLDHINATFSKVPSPLYIRSHREITAMFNGLEILDPGVIPVRDWPTPGQGSRHPMTTIGGIGRVP